MLDNALIVDTKDLAKAVKHLAGAFFSDKHLEKFRIEDSKGAAQYICPNLISRICPKTLYNPEREGVEVHYVTGERFSVDLTTDALVKQLGL